ncbi:MAG TPA: hypothetical protein VFI99_18570 [Nocardioides sp.]|nr:hypothetical protein [Nocardioides sp.]
MAGRQDQLQATVVGAGRRRVVVEGVAALIGLAALSAALFGLLTWAVVQLVRMLATGP